MKQFICRKIIYIVNIHRYLHFATVLQVTMDMFTRFATRVEPLVLPVEQELLTLPEHMSSPRFFVEFVLLNPNFLCSVSLIIVYPVILFPLAFVFSVLHQFTASNYPILDFGVTSHNVIDQSMIINFEMKKIFGGEAKQNPRDST